MNNLRILIVSQKGGVGKSTLSANLAAWFSEIDTQSTVLVDLDPHGSSSSWLKNARDCGAKYEHFVTNTFSERRWLIDARNKIRKYLPSSKVVICDLTWTAAMDSEFMHEFDLVVVPTSVSSIELNATIKFLENIKWVFEARDGIPPSLLLCPSRVLDEQLNDDPFSSENFPISFMLLPPILDDIEIRKYFKESFIYDNSNLSATAFKKCAESIKQAGEIHKKTAQEIKLSFANRRVIDRHNTKLSRFMSQKSSDIQPVNNANSVNFGNRTKRNLMSDKKVSISNKSPSPGKVSGLMKILTSALVNK
ncbi:MAG: hypothetical protein CMP38_05670 [Rickettsiales bacterium]|nr:hypothetical protein [Rickettsiales bacterium]OUW00672.1 MAG: hypothetical protein CBD16_06270 [Betaproteobacteria bacterium TMED156]|tara:strand:+ start:734 stop:1654 length:921 start_codon:yes stop_codon:yes gene_type:complete